MGAHDQALTRPIRGAWWTLALLTIAYVLSFVDRLVVSVLVEPLKADLNLSDVQISLIQGAAFAVFYAIMGVPLGRMADLFSRRALITVGIVVWSIATVTCGLVSSFGALFAARVLVGIGEAALSPAAYSLFADSFPRDRLARVIGIYTSGAVAGSGIALLAGSAVLAAFTARGVMQWPLLGELAPWQSTFVTVGLPGLAIAALVAFTAVEPRRAPRDMSPPVSEVLRWIGQARTAYVLVFTTWALNSVVGYGYVNWAPVYLVREFGLTPSNAGMSFGLVMLSAGSIGPIVGGVICDRLTRRGDLAAPMRVNLTGFTVLAVIGLFAFSSESLQITLALMAVITFCFTALLSLGPVAIQLMTPGPMRGQMSAVNLMIGNMLGLGLGPLLSASFARIFYEGNIGSGIATTIVTASACGAVLALMGLTRFRQAATVGPAGTI